MNDAPQIWNYHPLSRQLIRTEQPCYPDPDPHTPENWLFPGNTTPVMPGPDVPGKDQEFDLDAQAWKYVDLPTGDTKATPAVGNSTPEELATSVLSQRDLLLFDAAIRIAPLQDAADLAAAGVGEISSEEQEALLAWKVYRVQLNRIHQQEGFPETVTWPAVPGTASTT